MEARDTIAPPPIGWRTPSQSDDRVTEMAAAIERIAGNVSCYAGGGSFAHRLRQIAAEINAPGIAPMP